MRRLVASVLLAGAAGALFVVARPFGSRDEAVRPLAEPADDRPPPSAAPASVGATPITPEVGASPERAAEPSTDAGATIHGIVLDRDTGRPIPNADVEVAAARLESESIVHPRRPGSATPEPRTSGPVARSTTDLEGRFSIPWNADRAADLEVSAPGHLRERRPASTEDELRISLRAGTPIRGRVRRDDGAGIAGAVVRADTVAKDATERAVWVGSTTVSDGSGSFEVLGLPGVTSRISATHPDYMPASVRAAPEGGPVDLPMVPALRTWFHLRSADGRPVSAPVVQWTRTSPNGSELGVGVVDLAHADSDAAPAPADLARVEADTFGPVNVPCGPSGGEVRFTVRLVGRLPWTSEASAVPVVGSQRTIEAVLERDPSVGSITVRLRDPEGRDLPFGTADTIASIRRMDAVALVGAPAMRNGSAVFEGLVAGTYRVFAAERRYGAATATVPLDAGQDVPADLVLPVASMLRVRVDAEQRPRRRARFIEFQLLRDGAPVAAFEDPPPGGAPDPIRSRTHFFVGTDGGLLRGLAAGRYQVQLLSRSFTASATEVELTVGGTAELELREKPR